MWVARNRPGFAFVESEDPPDAADGVPEPDGRELCGCREGWNYPMVKREVEIVAHLLLGVVALEMIIRGGVLQLHADLQDGEASPAAGAGPFLEIGEEKEHCPGREVTSHPDFSLGLTADLGQMKGNRRSVCKRSGVQEITSFDRSMYRKFKFCLRIHKLGAFLKCFSCSHLFVGTVTQRCNSLWFEMDHMRHVISRIVTLQCSLKQNLICFGF